MATQTGKKARRAGGTRFACKRAKARKTKKRSWGHLPYSVEAKNAEEAVRANDKVIATMAAARREKGFEPDANIAVPVSKSSEQVQTEMARARRREAA